MRSGPRFAAAILSLVLGVAAASDPRERLPDPAQEARARALFAGVRCVVCQNESIDDSEADLAADLRHAVREQVRQGRTDAEIRAFLQARYGDFILLKPPFNAANLALWATPFVLLVGGALHLLAGRRRRVAGIDPAAALTEEEEKALAQLETPAPNGQGFAARAPQETPGPRA